MLTPELKAQMVKIAGERKYSLEQLSDPETMRGLMKDALAALDKLCMEAIEGRTWRGKDIFREIAASAYMEIKGRALVGQVERVLAG